MSNHEHTAANEIAVRAFLLFNARSRTTKMTVIRLAGDSTADDPKKVDAQSLLSGRTTYWCSHEAAAAIKSSSKLREARVTK